MAPSPRKRAQVTTTSAFSQTWDDKDATSLETNALPITKIPRAWERRREVKRTGQGKGKEIWRRFNLRSRVPDTLEHNEEEQHDSRSRAIKKLQHLSPKAMEKSTIASDGRKLTFKATRWDRRKSVLSRKKVTRRDDSLLDTGVISENEIDLSTATTEDMDISLETSATTEETKDFLTELKLKDDERRSTFTFTTAMTTPHNWLGCEDVADNETLNEAFETPPTEDFTLARLFRFPVKSISTQSQSPKQVDCSVLPPSETDVSLVDAIAQVQDAVEPVASIKRQQIESRHGTEMVELDNAEVVQKASPVLEPVEGANDVANPQLGLMTGETVSDILEIDQPGAEYAEMSDVPGDPEVEGNNDANVEADLIVPDENGSIDEGLNEASLQLVMQRDYEQALETDQLGSTETSMPSIEVSMEHQHPQNEAMAISALDDEAYTKTDHHIMEINASEAQSAETVPDQLLDNIPMEVSQASADAYNLSDEGLGIDITDGMTLSFASMRSASTEPTPRKLHSPPPPPRSEPGPDDITMTVALDEATAILKDFLYRAAASKAEKAAIITHRRESIRNRRDSDVVRHALASPCKALEERDSNSPSKYDNEATLDLSQILTLSMPCEDSGPPTLDPEGSSDDKSLRGSRRSLRTKKSRLPALASAGQAQASKIAIRRADGNEVVVLKKNDVQEVASLTRANTRKNKQGAFGVSVRLLKLAMDAPSLPAIEGSTREIVAGKNVRWDETLAYYQENPVTIANQAAEAESLATPDELSMPEPAIAFKTKNKAFKNSTPKIRRVRGLGTTKGTPGKCLLAPTAMLSDSLQEEREAETSTDQQLSRPKATKVKKMVVASSTSIDSAVLPSLEATKLPTLDIAPIGVQPTVQRKSRLAPPKKVMLPQAVVTMPEGKENIPRPGLSDATPKKGIPAPKIIVPPTVGVESGLPRRRRGRRVL